MKKTLVSMIAIAAATLATACAHEQTVATAPTSTVEAREQAAPAQPAFAPALWVIRDADSTLYLYGTIHLRRAGEDWADARVRAAIDESAEVWTELQIDPTVEAQMGPLIQQLGLNPPGQPLSSQLTAEQNAILAQAAQQLGAPAAALDPLRPWLASLQLSVGSLMQAGFDPNAGVDRQVDAYAEAAGKTMRWFETPEQQLGFLAGLSQDVQIEMLMDTAGDLQGGVALLNRIDTAWSQGNLNSLESDLIAEMRDMYPELYEAILTRRNADWVETLSAELAGSGVDFVAVGAAHLIGPESVIAMMEARGFTAERVTN
jgi:hypothetical protein